MGLVTRTAGSVTRTAGSVIDTDRIQSLLDEVDIGVGIAVLRLGHADHAIAVLEPLPEEIRDNAASLTSVRREEVTSSLAASDAGSRAALGIESSGDSCLARPPAILHRIANSRSGSSVERTGDRGTTRSPSVLQCIADSCRHL